MGYILSSQTAENITWKGDFQGVQHCNLTTDIGKTLSEDSAYILPFKAAVGLAFNYRKMLQKHEMAPAQQVVSAVQAAAGVPGLAEPCSAEAALQMVPEILPVPHDGPQGRATGGKGRRKWDGMGRRNRVGRDAGSKSRLRTGRQERRQGWGGLHVASATHDAEQ